MLIDNEIKLDYKDVLIRPKRSTLTSRKEVNLKRRYTFANYTTDFPDNIREQQNGHYYGIPIMAANGGRNHRHRLRL